jgi:ATPase subunit of ABC transporter with duplicated ATPase domains
MLEEALSAYTGTLLTASHDTRYLENAGVQRTVRLPG